MKEINKNEMLLIEGGASSTAVIGIVAAIVSFALGIIEGYLKPKSCN